MTERLAGGTRALLDALRANLISYDLYVVATMTVYVALAVIFYPYVDDASGIILADVLIATTIASLAVLFGLTGSRIVAVARRFYIIPVTYLLYEQVHAFVRVVHPKDYDDLLIALDRAIFGVDPTVWIGQFATPWLTEYLQICYVMFYLLPIMHAVQLVRAGDLDRLDTFVRGMTFCYVISYLLYFVLPAIGPRFTLHDFVRTDIELPGLWLTPWLREIVNQGGGVDMAGVDPVTIVNRDCMPSGHTMMTLVNILLAYRFRSGLRHFFLLIGGSLIIATVYMRYHYVVDVLVGAALAVICLPLEPMVDRHLRRWLRQAP